MIKNIIVAVDSKTFGIGNNGGIPWTNKDDMKWFKKLTTDNTVIMGWNTFISIGKALPNRTNIVISSRHTLEDTNDIDTANIILANDIDDAIAKAEEKKHGMIYVIGGASIYKQFLERDLIDSIYIDYIHNTEEYEYDTLFPIESVKDFNKFNVSDTWSKVFIDSSSDGVNEYVAWFRKRLDKANSADNNYLSILGEVLKHGIEKDTRAGKTHSVFGRMKRFDVSERIPVLSTKKVFTKGCIHELLWFLKGDTNIKYLVENKTHIWDDDAYRHYRTLLGIHNDYVNRTDNGNLWVIKDKEHFIEDVLNTIIPDDVFLYDGAGKKIHYQYGDLGPVYGKQWTNWDGINQIEELIAKLMKNPDDRRLIVSAWNVGDFSKMALPPCHYMSQWYTTKLTNKERNEYYRKTHDNLGLDDMSDETLDLANVPTRKLSMMWSQRSVDTCLGLPYNILSYSILLHMVAQVVNMVPFEVVCTLGDVHVYDNQIEQAELQMLRNPYLFEMPTIELNKDINSINDFKFEDIKIKGYESYPVIKYPLSVGI